MSADGWIKIHKKFLTWEWWDSSDMVQIFLYLLLSANFKESRYQGHTIKRGQLVSGRKKIAEDCSLSEQTVRTCLKRLKSTNEITITSTSKYSIITICNYSRYQGDNFLINQQINQVSNQQLTSNQPATNQQLTTSEEYKKEKNIRNKERERRAKEFRATLAPFSSQYPREMIEDFYEYWTEPNKSGTRMRFELERTWSISRRLKTWAKNEKQFRSNFDEQEYGAPDKAFKTLERAMAEFDQLRGENNRTDSEILSYMAQTSFKNHINVLYKLIAEYGIDNLSGKFSDNTKKLVKEVSQ